MIEDETSADPKAHATPETYGETLLYDYAKHLTGLSLLTLGGVLTVTEAGGRSEVQAFPIGFVLVSVAIAGVLAFHVTSSLVDARATGQPSKRHLPRMLKASTGFLGMGLGAFLTVWLDLLR